MLRNTCSMVSSTDVPVLRNDLTPDVEKKVYQKARFIYNV